MYRKFLAFWFSPDEGIFMYILKRYVHSILWLNIQLFGIGIKKRE